MTARARSASPIARPWPLPGRSSAGATASWKRWSISWARSRSSWRAAWMRHAHLPIGLNDHRDGILRTTTVPSGLPAGTLSTAERFGTELARGLDLVGLVALEMFVTSDGRRARQQMRHGRTIRPIGRSTPARQPTRASWCARSAACRWGRSRCWRRRDGNLIGRKPTTGSAISPTRRPAAYYGKTSPGPAAVGHVTFWNRPSRPAGPPTSPGLASRSSSRLRWPRSQEAQVASLPGERSFSQ